MYPATPRGETAGYHPPPMGSPVTMTSSPVCSRSSRVEYCPGPEKIASQLQGPVSTR